LDPMGSFEYWTNAIRFGIYIKAMIQVYVNIE
jgi:hypothetical protein